jgi:AcrR family transcriptional regulator
MRSADVASRGEDTRQRLLETATQLFADAGFAKVTVRDICRAADTNLASVNYHYGDKFGLYMAVVRTAADVMWSLNDLTMQPESISPEVKLRHYIRTYITRITDFSGPAAWIHRLMHHEMSEPTPAAAWIVEHAIRPRLTYLAGVIAELLHVSPDDRRVRHGVQSVQALCLSVLPNPFRTLVLSDWPGGSDDDGIEAVVEYIMTFSLGGLRAIERLND